MTTEKSGRTDPGLVLIDAIYDHIRFLDDAVYDIRCVANNLNAVGMERPATELFEAVKGLKESAKAISDAHAGNQSNDLRHSEQMAGNLLMLAIKGIPSKPAA